MKTVNETSSLAFFSLTNYAGTRTSVEHGATGMVADSSSGWEEQSVAISGTLYTCIHSMVDTGNPLQSYAGHVESYVTTSQSDLKSTYPASQYTLQYLGLDASLAVPVLVDIQGETTEGQLNTLACSGPVPQSGTSSVTTLILPDTDGILGFIGVSENSSTYIPLKCGVYDSLSHEVTWQSDASLMMIYSGGKLTLTWSTGQPDGWSFGTPVLQSDNSWRVTLSVSGEVSGNTISSLTSDKASIDNDGVSSAVITAAVLDGNGQPASGVTVSWDKTQGNLSELSSVTDANGLATTTLTDSGDTGTVTVTASIPGSSKSTDVTITNDSADLPFYMYCTTEGDRTNGNYVAFYGKEGTQLVLTVPAGWHINSGGQTSLVITLDSTGYGSAIVYYSKQDIGIFSMVLTATANSYSQSAMIRTYNEGGATEIKGTQYAPADGRTPNIFYTRGYTDTVTVSGNAIFENGTDSINPKSNPLGVNFFDAVAENVTVSQIDGLSYSSEFIPLKPYQLVNSLTSDTTYIKADNIDVAYLTATIQDPDTGQPISGAVIFWDADQGSLTPLSTETDINGKVYATLTVKTGKTGVVNVMASVKNGCCKVCTVTIVSA